MRAAFAVALLSTACGNSVNNTGPGGGGTTSPTTTTSSGGSGGEGGGGASSGSGAGGAACIDTIVTQPLMVVDANIYSEPVIVAMPDTGDFALAWRDETASTVSSTIVDPTGAVQFPPIVQSVRQFAATAIAASNTGYAVARIVTMPDGVVVDRIDAGGSITTSMLEPGSFVHADLVRATDGYVAVLRPALSGEDLEFATLTDATDTFALRANLPASTLCCGYPTWQSFPLPDGEVGVVWESRTGPDVEFARIDGAGLVVASSHTSIGSLTQYPTYAATLGATAVVGDHMTAVQLDIDGNELSNTPALDVARGVALGSSGDVLRLAVIGPYGVDWYRLGANGTPPALMLRLEPGAVAFDMDTALPSIAYNGTGFGVVWLVPFGGGVYFSYIEPCTL